MRSVLVAREFDDFSRILADSGFAVINCPVIETTELYDLADVEKRIKHLAEYDAAFFTSPRSAEIFLEKWRALGGPLPRKIYALGNRTRNIFEIAGIDVVFDEKARTAAEMIASIPNAEIAGRRFLFVRGRKSMRTIPELLSPRALVDEWVVYDTRAIDIPSEIRLKIEHEAEAGNLAAVCFFSPSGAESFFAQINVQSLVGVQIAAIGETTAKYLDSRGIRVGLISEAPEAPSFARQLLVLLGK